MATVIEGNIIKVERKVVGQKQTPMVEVLIYDNNQVEPDGKNTLVSVAYWNGAFNLDNIEKFVKEGAFGKIMVDEIKKNLSQDGAKIFHNANAVPFGFSGRRKQQDGNQEQRSNQQGQGNNQNNYQNNQQNYQNNYQNNQQQQQQQQQQPQQEQSSGNADDVDEILSQFV